MENLDFLNISHGKIVSVLPHCILAWRDVLLAAYVIPVEGDSDIFASCLVVFDAIVLSESRH